MWKLSIIPFFQITPMNPEPTRRKFDIPKLSCLMHAKWILPLITIIYIIGYALFVLAVF